MEKAIKLAIEGGWKGMENVGTSEETCLCCGGITILDPLFWQALGKSLGWKNNEYTCLYIDTSGGYKTSHEFDGFYWDEYKQKVWQYNWHRFIDHLAENKSAESFFEKLLTNKQ